ncbi:MAG: 2TM domain-containing protein [Clostridiales bacterium]|nr:2TM domain-containing protein [Clostridiales bacterium]
MKIRQHVEEMFRDVPDSDEKQSLLGEMIADAEEKAADLMADGKDEEDAVNKALVELGDLSEIKLNLMGVSPRRAGGGQRRRRNNLLYSVIGSLLIIALMVFINLYYSPDTIWFVYPMFGVIWWPLSVFLHYLNHRDGDGK